MAYGYCESQSPEASEAKSAVLLSSGIAIVDFDTQAAVVAGRIRMELRRAGTPMGPYDTLIAAHALRYGAALATGTIGEFSRVNGLVLIDWSA